MRNTQRVICMSVLIGGIVTSQFVTAACPYDSEDYTKSVASKYALSYPPSLLDSNCGLTFLLEGNLSFDFGSLFGDLGNLFSQSACDFVQNTLSGNLGSESFNFTPPSFDFNIESNTTADDFILPY